MLEQEQVMSCPVCATPVASSGGIYCPACVVNTLYYTRQVPMFTRVHTSVICFPRGTTLWARSMCQMSPPGACLNELSWLQAIAYKKVALRDVFDQAKAVLSAKKEVFEKEHQLAQVTQPPLIRQHLVSTLKLPADIIKTLSCMLMRE